MVLLMNLFWIIEIIINIKDQEIFLDSFCIKICK